MPQFVFITWINGSLYMLKDVSTEGAITTTRQLKDAKVVERVTICQMSHAWLTANSKAVWHWALYDAVERMITTLCDRTLSVNHQPSTINR